MMSSMICHLTSLEPLQGEALRTVAYIFIRIPTKATTKIPYKLLTDKKPSLKHLYIYEGCLIEEIFYKFNEKKLDSKMMSYNFIGHFEKSKGISFMILRLSLFSS